MRWCLLAFTAVVMYSQNLAFAQDFDDYVESDTARAERHVRQDRREHNRANTRRTLTTRTQASIDGILSNLKTLIPTSKYISDNGYGKYHFDNNSVLAIINSTKVIVDDHLGDLPHADKGPRGQRIVHIPIGFVLALDAVNLAVGQAACCNGKIQHQLQPWLESFEDKSAGVFRRIAISRKYNSADQDKKASRLFNDIAWRPKTLCESAGYAPLDCDVAVRNDATLQAVYGMATDASLGYIVMHELGHHILGHVEGDKNVKDSTELQETMADKIAVDLFWSSGLNPDYMLGAISLLAIAEQAERDAEIDSHPNRAANGVYPETRCRITLAWNRALQRAKDPGFLTYLEQIGKGEKAQQLKELAARKLEEAKSCPGYQKYL